MDGFPFLLPFLATPHLPPTSRVTGALASTLRVCVHSFPDAPRDYYGGARRDDYYDRAPPPRRDERDYRRDDRCVLPPSLPHPLNRDGI
jgi:hypothetical protein